jgi:site-specific DNA-methyltransferase (adenine-specific)
MIGEEYKNKVFNVDVIKILKELPDNSVDMIYSDPDYNVGINYSGKNYKKKWDEYIDWYVELISESMRVLKSNGNLFTINYPKQNAYLLVKYLDHAAYNVSEYVWIYNTNVGHSPKKFTTAHRSILHATKTKNNKFYKDQVVQPYKNPTDKRIIQRISEGHEGRMPYSWIYADLVKNVSKDKTFHSCQIPLSLFELLLKASTKENDTVFIHFGGSGSEIIHAKNLERNYISCEIHSDYHKMIMQRLSNNGHISLEYKLDFIKERFGGISRKNDMEFALFDNQISNLA